MRILLHPILLLVAMFTPIFAVEHDPDSLKKLMKDLRRVIPEGWKVSVNQFHDSEDGEIHIEVWRTDKVQFYEFFPVNGHPGVTEDPEAENLFKIFYFNFYLREFLSPEDHARLTKENAVIEAQLVKFTKAMSNVERHGKSRAYDDTSSNGYFPKTEDEKKRLKEFVDYEKSHPKHFIPHDFHYQKMSFSFYDQRNLRKLQSKKINQECNEVLKSLKKVFKAY